MQRALATEIRCSMAEKSGSMRHLGSENALPRMRIRDRDVNNPILRWSPEKAGRR